MPPRSSAAKSAAGSPCCRSPQGSSVGNPPVMVSRWRSVGSGESALGSARPASSGTYSRTGSSSRSAPASRSARIVDAVKLLVIEAMRNTVAASGVHQRAVGHHAVGQAGLAVAGREVLGQLVDLQVIRHRRYLLAGMIYHRQGTSFAAPAASGVPGGRPPG